jgi:hypothetical protein
MTYYSCGGIQRFYALNRQPGLAPSCLNWINGVGLMKKVTYKKRDLARFKGRFVSIREFHPDADCDTNIAKNFVYLLSRADQLPEKAPTPTIQVTKKIDTAANTETFRLKVKGDIYISRGRFIYRVEYCHSLKVRLLWKIHVLSSKPAALA